MSKIRSKLHELIFEADTRLGRIFDLILLVFILLSVVVVMLESVESYRNSFGLYFDVAEWIFTALFSLEYILRIISVKKPIKYVTSFYGVIDLLSILPSYIGFFIGVNQLSSIKTIRTIRLIRIFRILKLIRYVKEATALKKAFIASKQRIIVFLFVVLSIVTLMGTIIYMIEDPKDGFTSIPRSIYWAIVTLTTVGYGDIAPSSPVGQFFASIIMILGYAIIAVPTGLISVELSKLNLNTQSCPACSLDGHDDNAIYCKSCGEELNPKDI
tara:strand:- start:509 stop:1321 length:813 start_codon:yes stop_codon:yes gene_type:complete